MTKQEHGDGSEEMVTDFTADEIPVSFTDRASYNETRSEGSEDDPPTDEADPSIDDIIANAQWVIMEKQQELIALSDLAAAEINVVKRSVVVTGIATLAAFVFACFCWLIANIGLVIALHHFGISNGVTTTIVFILNLALAVIAFLIARNAYSFISVMPAFRTILSGLSFGKKQPGE